MCIKFFPYKEDGVKGVLCETDYLRRLDLLCAKCCCAIRGPHINAVNKKFHVEHFTCDVCNTVLPPSSNYFQNNGNIYCQEHFSELFVNRCSGCHTLLIRQQSIKFDKNVNLKEQWHPECYVIYKSWNVKLVLEDEVPKEPPVEPKDFNAEIEKQKIIEEKIGRIWSILSAFEESSAECMAEILSYVSENLYLDGIEQAGNFLCHVDVLFSGIDEIEYKLSKFNDNTGLQHTKEPKNLARKIIALFSLLKPNPKQDTSQEIVEIGNDISKIIKILIQSALKGALKLENVYKDKTAVDSFLAKFLTLDEMQSESRRQHLMTSNEYSTHSEYCPVCHKSVEEECIKLNGFRWHLHCFYCQNCKKDLHEAYEEGRLKPKNEKVYCKNCLPTYGMSGFVYVTQLKQYTFLLKDALKRLYIISTKE
ncbi:hypothetical protein BCR36DRAFT_415163 [Piromyces finnis]|uniref:LIM zinc-binding domain-containing protein n=1 Tax=Piromyces finnis TaxID=1754191 RepID=A0A1Y1UZJ3_9FUNG|nr:hypothetical protein BCR36DRAFT_415163 [Piromyces finnis]|eukprot:ORX44124.1 hypothetical protein BCR36DRAFT_415163 [Piromyces finnis]